MGTTVINGPNLIWILHNHRLFYIVKRSGEVEELNADDFREIDKDPEFESMKVIDDDIWVGTYAGDLIRIDIDNKDYTYHQAATVLANGTPIPGQRLPDGQIPELMDFSASGNNIFIAIENSNFGSVTIESLRSSGTMVPRASSPENTTTPPTAREANRSIPPLKDDKGATIPSPKRYDQVFAADNYLIYSRVVYLSYDVETEAEMTLFCKVYYCNLDDEVENENVGNWKCLDDDPRSHRFESETIRQQRNA